MRFFRRHRRAFQTALMIVALTSMTYGFLVRVGLDPLASLRATEAPRAE